MQTNKLCHSGAISQFRRRRFQLRKPKFAFPPLPAFRRALSPAGVLPLVSPLLCQNPNQEMRAVDSSDLACLEEHEDDENGDFRDRALETCITRVFPQALTLEHGFEALKEAFHELKLNPPTTTSGLIRFEVAVPPKSKAYSWFYAEPESSEVFPQFYISKEPNITTHHSVHLNNTRGIFGIGAAVDLGHLSSGKIGNWSLFRRYLMVDLPNITTYGYIGANCEFEASFMKLDSGSFYFVIPQIELNEYEGFSLLAGTIAWSEDSFCSIKEAFSSYHMSLIQACSQFSASATCRNIFMKSILGKFNMITDEITQLVFLDSLSLCHSRRNVVRVEMVSPSSWQMLQNHAISSLGFHPLHHLLQMILRKQLSLLKILLTSMLYGLLLLLKNVSVSV